MNSFYNNKNTPFSGLSSVTVKSSTVYGLRMFDDLHITIGHMDTSYTCTMIGNFWNMWAWISDCFVSPFIVYSLQVQWLSEIYLENVFLKIFRINLTCLGELNTWIQWTITVLNGLCVEVGGRGVVLSECSIEIENWYGDRQR